MSDRAGLDYLDRDHPAYWVGHRDSGSTSRTPSDLSPETEALAADLAEVFDDAFNLLLLKHENYGSQNIAASPGGPLNGLRVRLHDKAARWNHMVDSGVDDKVGESLVETFTDALNYCAIAILVLRGQWPGMKEGTS